jgi:two-component system cell cycle sensor histidine kinase/response regulator CckA
MTNQRHDAAPPKRAKILVVEDEPAVRELVCEILRTEGYEVLEAWNGPVALTLLQQNQGKIWLVLTNGIMQGMTGPELALLVATFPSPPQVLMMSAYPPVALKRVAGLDTELAFIQKPFTAEQLADRIRQLRRRER